MADEPETVETEGEPSPSPEGQEPSPLLAEELPIPLPPEPLPPPPETERAQAIEVGRLEQCVHQLEQDRATQQAQLNLLQERLDSLTTTTRELVRQEFEDVLTETLETAEEHPSETKEVAHGVSRMSALQRLLI